ncbi:MAG: hypothetical protein KBC29_01965 [Candidatus Pacebacteria bacterium]|nr:hypothetical protein [Candidatus Paceibacterota bacterium]
MNEVLLCPDAIPNVLGMFDFSIAPRLLFYSYIPIVFISLIMGFLIFFKDKFSLRGSLFLTLTISFAFWVLSILFQWTAAGAGLVHFSWQILALFEVLVYISSSYFVYVYVYKKDLGPFLKIFFFLFLIVVSLLLPSEYMMREFDLINCQSVLGLFWGAIYVFEFALLPIILFLGISKSHKIPDPIERKQSMIITIGNVLFLAIFALSNIVGEITQQYEFNLFGPIGMVLFLGLVTYSMVRYKAFNMRLIGVQVLVLALVALVFSLLFINSLDVIHVIIVITLGLLSIVGYFLIRGVMREIRQKERLTVLSNSLSEANEKLKDLDKLKTEFLSLASHQLRSPLTAITGYTSMLLDGSFGEVQPKQKEAIDRVFESSRHLTKVVEDLLNVSKIEQGGMKYEMKPFDFTEAVSTLSADLSVTAEKKGLKLKFSTDSSNNYFVNGDMEKIRQVIINLIDNSIKYTETGGSIDVSVTYSPLDRVLLSIKDTGMGIEPSIAKTLFQKFSRGEGGKVNTGGSGLGLYLAKEIIDAHKGKIWLESKGKGKGTEFYVELSALDR